MDEDNDLSRGLRYGLIVLLLAILSEGGIYIVVFIFLKFKISILQATIAMGVAMLLFLFGFVIGFCKNK